MRRMRLYLKLSGRRRLNEPEEQSSDGALLATRHVLRLRQRARAGETTIDYTSR
jgi:hypothetical protein